MNIAVYTAIFGGYDTISPHPDVPCRVLHHENVDGLYRF